MTPADSGPIDLSIGHPGYEPAPPVQAVAVKAIAGGLGGYAPAGGLARLRSRLATRLTERNGIAAIPEQVVVTTGASLGIFATLSTVCGPGDTVLVPDPGFPLYRVAATNLHLKCASYPLAATGEPDWTALAAMLPGSRLLVWNYPSNPLGALADAAWFPRLFALVAQHPQLTVLSDEVYGDLYLTDGHPGATASHAGALADRVESVFSFSKSFGMAAWRVGYLHARTELTAAIASTHWAASMSTCTAGQLAAIAALRLPEEYLEERRAFLRGNRDLAVARLSSSGLDCAVPDGGFFAWADTSRFGVDGATFALRSGAEAGVLISRGIDFGPSGSQRVRINFAVPTPTLVTAPDRLERWLSTVEPQAARG